MNERVDIVKSEVERLKHLHPHKQLWVSIAGPPGSGKSTLSERLLGSVPNSKVIPMDGFHYYRSQLDEFEDHEMAHMRRGAYWTFDAKKFISCLRNARRTGCGSFPSFDHSIGDPVENDIQISESDEVIFIEGLYLLLDIPPWNEVKGLVDLSVFIDCDEETMTQRLCHRHKLAMGLTDEEAFKRASTNDIPNSVEINKSRVHADIILH